MMARKSKVVGFRLTEKDMEILRDIVKRNNFRSVSDALRYIFGWYSPEAKAIQDKEKATKKKKAEERKILKRERDKARRKQKRKSDKKKIQREQRYDEMVALRKRGWTYSRIGKKYSISRQRVQQILKHDN